MWRPHWAFSVTLIVNLARIVSNSLFFYYHNEFCQQYLSLFVPKCFIIQQVWLLNGVLDGSCMVLCCPPQRTFLWRETDLKESLLSFFPYRLKRMIHSRKRPILYCFHEMIMLKEKYFLSSKHPLLISLTSCAVLLITKWIVLWKQPLIQLIKFLLRILTVNDFYLIILQWEPSWCLFSQLKHGGNLIQLIILIHQRDLSIYVVTDFNMLFSNICKPLYYKHRFITFRWILNVLLEVM